MKRIDFFIDLLADFTGQNKETIRERLTHYRKIAEDNSYMDGEITEEESVKIKKLVASNPGGFAQFLAAGASEADGKIGSN